MRVQIPGLFADKVRVRFTDMRFVILACILGLGFSASSQELYPSGLVSVGDHTKTVFAVDKQRRFLRVYQFDEGVPHLMGEYPSDIGKNQGDKEKANDYKTPTGIYFLQKKLVAPHDIPFSMYGSEAFTTDYPNIFDKRDAKGGGGIWLHAVPDSVALTRGSRGCVVVRDEIIKKLGEIVTLNKTPLVIFDHLEEVSADDYKGEQAKFFGFFEQWRKAWETEDVDTYMKFYDPTFRNAQMNYNQWYHHKKKLKGLYEYIKVTLSEPLIIRNRDQVVIRTLQTYESNKHKDYGLKTIHARYSPESGFKIIREDWEKRSSLDLPVQAKTLAPTEAGPLPQKIDQASEMPPTDKTPH